MLHRNNTVLTVVDVQGKLAALMHEREALFAGLKTLIRGTRILGLPILWAEQNPEGLGPTVPEVAGELAGLEPIPKKSFSCLGDLRFRTALEDVRRRQVLLCGIECHVCVYQTAVDLLERGYEVHVAADAVSSRTPGNREIGLQRMQHMGAAVTCTEMALFELLRCAEGDAFKEILALVK